MRELTRREILAALSVGAGALGALSAAGDAAAETQPHMRVALEALRTADKELREAVPDKGGHRAAALELLQKVISEVEKGIAYDNKN